MSPAKPEDAINEISDAEMYTFSQVLANGESIADIKEVVEDAKKPKPLDDDTAMAVFIDQVNALSGSQNEKDAEPSEDYSNDVEAHASAPKVKAPAN